MDANMVKSFCLHSLGFRAGKIIIEGCEFPVKENSTWEVVKAGAITGTGQAEVAAGSMCLLEAEKATGSC